MKAPRAGISRAGTGAGTTRAAKKEKTLSSASQIKLFLRALTYPLSYPLYLLSLYITILVCSMLHTYEPGYGEQLVYILSQDNAAEILKPAIYHRIQIELLIAAIECISSYLQSELSMKVERKMQEEFYKCLLEKDAEYYDGKKVGDLTSKLTQDLQSVKALAIMDMAGLFSKIFNIGWSLFFMMQISPQLTMILAIVIAPRVGLMWSVKDHFRNFHRNIMKLKGENNAIVTEAFINIRTVKTFSSEEKEFEKFQQKLGQYHAANKSLAQKDMLLNVVRAILKTVMFGTVALQGGSLVLEIKEFTAFDLARFISYARQFSMATLTLETNIKKMIGSIANAESIFEELDMKPKVNPNKEKIVYEKNVRGEILFRDVSFSYPQKKEVQVLKKLNLEIKKGEHIAIVGESGGGKSTITSLLQRLYDPTEGEIQIDGKNLKEYNLEWLHSKMGYISQEPSLFTGTIEENVVYGVKNYEEKELEKAVEGAYMRKFVDDKKIFPEGMKSYVGERGNKLSGGQKQRVAIARALIKNPDIMILDEATSALDAESEHQIMKGFEELLKNKGQTVIVIAHRLSTIMHCDRILVVQNGEIIETGNHEELVEKGGAYKNLVEKQLVGGSGTGSGSGGGSPMRIRKAAKDGGEKGSEE